MKRPKVTELFNDAVDSKPVSYDWSSHQVGDGEGEWEWWDAVECGGCGKYDTFNSGGGEQHESCKANGSFGESDGPMMSYYYPLPAFPSDVHKACKAIRNLPLVIVRFDGDDKKAALALSGGGMDLSWEI